MSFSKPHILFVCEQNQWRSPTAARVYAHDQRIEVRSAGVEVSSAHWVNRQDMEWADLVLVMEDKHRDRLKKMFSRLELPPIECLEIPDDFHAVDDAKLIELIREGTEAHLADCFGFPNAIRPCRAVDFETIYEIVNEAALAYKGVITADCWHMPYMSKSELREAIAGGIDFWGYKMEDGLAGVMGFQRVEDVTLIRHAYVRTTHRRHGIGGQLLQFLLSRIETPVLVGTWEAADWAVRFYEKHGFKLVEQAEKDRLLPKYWGVSQRQIETSVVLGDAKWFESHAS
jgi:predicted protein tyrosine phosphatase/N-acetylglutamate synthase-like GNAT family acetyltransferase